MQKLEYGTREINYHLQQSNRRSLTIEVHPDMIVWVFAPADKTLSDIEEKLLKRARWIVKQQAYFEQFLPRTPQREYIAGETHLYLGRRYVLRTANGKTNEVNLKAVA